jgi:drug/metabolite transporter (DMT)-like permease
MTWFFVALISALLSASAAITQKKVLYNLNALKFSFLLSLVNLLFSIPFFFFIDYTTINITNLSILLIKSLIGVAAFYCVMLSLKNLEISNALPLLALTPGFVAIFAFLLLGETLRMIEVVGLIFLIAGTFILENKSPTVLYFPFGVFYKSKYHRFILIALLLFTASSILDKLLLVKLNFSPISLTAFQHIFFAVLFSLAYVFFKDKESSDSIIVEKSNLGWIALISLFTIGYRFTQIAAISLASVALVLAIKRTSVFWATLIGGKIFNDKDLLKRSIAAILILVGAILILRE